MLSKSKKVVSFALLSCLSIVSYADDDPVNCRTELVEQRSVYEGYAFCTSYYLNSVNRVETVFLDTVVSRTNDPTVLISRIVQDSLGRNVLAKCFANVPYVGKEDIYEEVCDYTPKLRPRAILETPYRTQVTAGATDRDGSIVSYEWWIDGIKQSETGPSLNFYKSSSNDNALRVIRIDVTDDDGYLETKTLTAGFKPFGDCGARICR